MRSFFDYSQMFGRKQSVKEHYGFGAPQGPTPPGQENGAGVQIQPKDVEQVLRSVQDLEVEISQKMKEIADYLEKLKDGQPTQEPEQGPEQQQDTIPFPQGDDGNSPPPGGGSPPPAQPAAANNWAA